MALDRKLRTDTSKASSDYTYSPQHQPQQSNLGPREFSCPEEYHVRVDRLAQRPKNGYPTCPSPPASVVSRHPGDFSAQYNLTA